MQCLNDGLEQAAARVPPARRVEGDSELRVALAIELGDRRDEGSDIGVAPQPVVNSSLDGVTQAPPAMAKQGEEETLPAAEVVIDAGVSHPDVVGDRPDLNGRGAALD